MQKKLIILSYFYPPANFVGGDRVAAWAKYLHKFGYYPTIITRNWNNGQKDLTDKIEDNSLKHEVFETHEVYRLPYNRTLRDKLNDYPNSKILSVLRKALSLFELIANNFFLRSIPYSNFYDFTVDLINKNPGKYSCLIASGRPFQLFSLANAIHKKTNIRWFADYRDEWNTFQNKSSKSRLTKLIGKLEAKSELRWTQNCESFITVSEYWQKSISAFIHRPGFVVMNGFEADLSKTIYPIEKDSDKLIISYIGTLYPLQNIKIFMQAAKTIADLYSSKLSIQINFVGTEYVPGQNKQIEILAGDKLNKNFFLFNRMDKQSLNKFYAESDFLLATSFEGIKGWYPVKIFEYSVTGTPILLCPGDNDVLDDFVHKTGSGEVAYTEEDCFRILKNVSDLKISGQKYPYKLNQDKLKFYSRENQTSILAKNLNQLL